MNTETTKRIKSLMESACSGAAGKSDGWRAEGVERMFIDEYGAEGFAGGSVEIRHGESNNTVRLELELAPELAAKVIGLCTNTSLGEIPILREKDPDKAVYVAVVGEGSSIELVEESALATRNAEIARLIREQRADSEELTEKPSADDPTELDFDVPGYSERVSVG